MSTPPRTAIRKTARWAVVAFALTGVARAADPQLPAIPAAPIPLPPLPAESRGIALMAPKLDDEPKPKGGPEKNPADGEKVPKKKAKEADEEKKEKETPEPKEPPPWKAWQPPGRGITLAECLAIARERQPAIRAAQYSLAASERGYLALMNIHRALELLSPDIPFRRQQALRGIAAATAEVRKAMLESVYDTTRVYYEYVRATQQEQTATGIFEQMDIFYRVAKNLVEAGVVDPRMKLDRFTLAALEAVIVKIQQLRDKASTGRKLAVAALTQAMGLDTGELVYPIATKLPVMGGTVTEEQVIDYALATRPELIQVAVLVDVTRLEVCAQDAIRRRNSVSTFASGSDVHARFLPPPVRNGEYRPGAVPPEMPGQMVGRKEDRVARAVLYSQRQDEVYRVTVSLVRLEAINAYLNWKATAQRMADAEKWFERGKRLAEESRAAAATKQDPELLVKNEALAGEAQAAYVEAVYEHLKALLTLERVTGGQVKVGFEGR